MKGLYNGNSTNHSNTITVVINIYPKHFSLIACSLSFPTLDLINSPNWIIGNNNQLIISKIIKISDTILSHGARKVYIHAPEAGFSKETNKDIIIVPSLDLPDNYIVSSVGAGDAFCSGILYSIYNDFDDQKALRLASCVAATNLSGNTSTDKASSYSDSISIEQLYLRKIL